MGDTWELGKAVGGWVGSKNMLEICISIALSILSHSGAALPDPRKELQSQTLERHQEGSHGHISELQSHSK